MSAIGDLKPPFTLEQLATVFRSRVDDLPGDIASPTQSWDNDDSGLLWTNDEICAYADEAQHEAARRIGGILDQTANVAIAHITVAAGVQGYAYDSRILKIERMKFVDSNADEWVLKKRTADWMDQRYRDWELEANATGRGTVEFYVEYTENRRIKLWRVPELAGTLHMTVWRLPVDRLSWGLRHKLLEIPPDYHYDLVDWMMYRAYLKRDAETENVELSAAHKAIFDERFGLAPSHRLERVRRQEHKTNRRVNAHYF